MNTVNKSHNSPVYEEGRDFTVEIQDTELGKRLFFRSPSGALIGYLSFNIGDSWEDISISIYIIDTVSSYSLEKNCTQTMKKFFSDHGYTGEGLEGFGVSMYDYALNYMRDLFPGKKIIILVNALEKNEAQVWKLLGKLQNQTKDLVEKITGGNEMHMATIFVNPTHDTTTCSK